MCARDTSTSTRDARAVGVVGVGLLDVVRAGDAGGLVVGVPGVAAPAAALQVAVGVVAVRKVDSWVR